MVNLDFDEQGRLIGIEVLAASSQLPKYCSSPRSGWTPKAHEPSGTVLAATAVRRAAGRKRLMRCLATFAIARYLMPEDSRGICQLRTLGGTVCLALYKGSFRWVVQS
ncbi:DUF2283 domain-containing protein [Streptomyces sp. NPDC051976]|uniref:DUF2283 domain-containing protein n=1 Tax=Streptomyces sp. NPDC051976 TaxID=3154947 RepID=UPI0034146DF1